MTNFERRGLFRSIAALGLAAALGPGSASAQSALSAEGTVPFKVSIPEEKLTRILRRVKEFQFYPPVRDDQGKSLGWRYGMDIDYLREIAEYWAKQYDWRKTEQRINKFKNFQTTIRGLKIHYVHEKGSGKSPKPLLIVHGWPYSFLSYLGVVERLAHPERFGGDADTGFDVVVVSVPGYEPRISFSSRCEFLSFHTAWTHSGHTESPR